MMLHDEGPCFAPRELRNSILLTHYGYWSAEPKPWGTYYDDNFLADPRFYQVRFLWIPSDACDAFGCLQIPSDPLGSLRIPSHPVSSTLIHSHPFSSPPRRPLASFSGT